MNGSVAVGVISIPSTALLKNQMQNFDVLTTAKDLKKTLKQISLFQKVWNVVFPA